MCTNARTYARTRAFTAEVSKDFNVAPSIDTARTLFRDCPQNARECACAPALARKRKNGDEHAPVIFTFLPTLEEKRGESAREREKHTSSVNHVFSAIFIFRYLSFFSSFSSFLFRSLISLFPHSPKDCLTRKPLH